MIILSRTIQRIVSIVTVMMGSGSIYSLLLERH